jgi:hypothetical protein
MKIYGELEMQLHAYLISALDIEEWPASRPSFTFRKNIPGALLLED